MPFTAVRTVDLAPGNRMIEGTYTATAYATNGVAIDLSSALSTRCERAEIVPANAATAAYFSQAIGWPSATLATAIKLLMMQPRTVLYDNDDAATDGVAAYVDEDASGGGLLQFVAPSDADVNQLETFIECANALDISSLSWKCTVWGY